MVIHTPDHFGGYIVMGCGVLIIVIKYIVTNDKYIDEEE